MSKRDLLGYILYKAFHEFDYEIIDRLQVEKITYFLQAIFENKRIERFTFRKNTYGPYSEEIIKLLEKMRRKQILSHSRYNYEYRQISDLTRYFKIEKMKELEVELGRSDLIQRIFETGRDPWAITNLSHQLSEVRNKPFGETVEPSLPSEW